MNWGQIEANWDQYRVQVKQKFDKLSDSDLDEIGGRRDALIGKVQERYDCSHDEAQKQLYDLESAMVQADHTLADEKTTAADAAVIGNAAKPGGA